MVGMNTVNSAVLVSVNSCSEDSYVVVCVDSSEMVSMDSSVVVCMDSGMVVSMNS